MQNSLIASIVPIIRSLSLAVLPTLTTSLWITLSLCVLCSSSSQLLGTTSESVLDKPCNQRNSRCMAALPRTRYASVGKPAAHLRSTWDKQQLGSGSSSKSVLQSLWVVWTLDRSCLGYGTYRASAVMWHMDHATKARLFRVVEPDCWELLWQGL
eukprot:2148520-Amphidinium_carterae.1